MEEIIISVVKSAVLFKKRNILIIIGGEMEETKAIVICPHCDNSTEVLLLINYCKIRFICPYCGNNITPKEGESCIFSTQADKRCPLKMKEEKIK